MTWILVVVLNSSHLYAAEPVFKIAGFPTAQSCKAAGDDLSRALDARATRCVAVPKGVQ